MHWNWGKFECGWKKMFKYFFFNYTNAHAHTHSPQPPSNNPLILFIISRLLCMREITLHTHTPMCGAEIQYKYTHLHFLIPPLSPLLFSLFFIYSFAPFCIRQSHITSRSLRTTSARFRVWRVSLSSLLHTHTHTHTHTPHAHVRKNIWYFLTGVKLALNFFSLLTAVRMGIWGLTADHPSSAP